MDEKYRTRPKGAIETTSQDLSRIPLASFYLSVHDPCDIDASPSYFIGATPRSFRNCTRGGGPQNVLLALFSRHGEWPMERNVQRLLKSFFTVSLLLPVHLDEKNLVLRFSFFFFLRKIYRYLRIICNKLR